MAGGLPEACGPNHASGADPVSGSPEASQAFAGTRVLDVCRFFCGAIFEGDGGLQDLILVWTHCLIAGPGFASLKPFGQVLVPGFSSCLGRSAELGVLQNLN